MGSVGMRQTKLAKVWMMSMMVCVNAIGASLSAPVARAAAPQGAAILTLNPTSNCAFLIDGTTSLTVTGGRMHINSYDSCGACSFDSPSLTVSDLYLVGGGC